MSERAAPSPEALDACTAVLMTVPREVAVRLETFLLANGVACRTRTSTLTPEQLAQEALRQASPTAASLLDSPVGRLFKGKLQRDLKAEIELHASGFEQPYDVLVRPEDLPPGLVPAVPGTDAARDRADAPAAGGGSDPWARPGEAPPPAAGEGSETPPPDAAPLPTIVAAGGEAPAQLCQLPWDQAWALVGRLAEAGIAAAVMEAEASARDVPMAERMVPVAVQPENLERARSFL